MTSSYDLSLMQPDVPTTIRPTLIAAFGTPGAMSAWGFNTLRSIAQHAFSDYAHIEANSMEKLRQAEVDGPATPLLVTSQYPEPSLIEFLRRTPSRIVLFIDSASDAFSYLLDSTDQSEISAVRAISASCACLAALRDLPGILIIRRDVANCYGIEQLTQSLKHHLQAPDIEPDRPIATLGFGPTHEEPANFDFTANPGCAPPSNADPASSTLVANVLEPFDTFFSGRALPPITWTRECFIRGDHPDEPVSGSVDLTGGARCVVYGPYFHLPAGEWIARIRLGFDTHVRDQSFAIEVQGPSLLNRICVSPPCGGIFAAQMKFIVTEPHTPLELRILTENGAIEGAITDLSAQISRAATLSC